MSGIELDSENEPSDSLLSATEWTLHDPHHTRWKLAGKQAAKVAPQREATIGFPELVNYYLIPYLRLNVDYYECYQLLVYNNLFR